MYIFIGWDYHNKVFPLDSLSNRDAEGEAWYEESTELVSPEAFLLGLWAATFSKGPHMVISPCFCVPIPALGWRATSAIKG